MNTPGSITKKIFTNTFAQDDSDTFSQLKSALSTYPMEAILIYNFKSNSLVFESGWKELLHLTEKPTVHTVLSRIHKKYRDQVLEILDCLFEQMIADREDVMMYGCTIEFKLRSQEGLLLPVVLRIGVYEAGEEGEALSCIMRCQRDDTLRIGGLARYTIYAPDDGFSEKLNQKYGIYAQINETELHILRMIARGLAFKEVADELNISKSSVEKRIQRMYKRFNVRSTAHLIGHAYDNFLLP